MLLIGTTRFEPSYWVAKSVGFDWTVQTRLTDVNEIIGCLNNNGASYQA